MLVMNQRIQITAQIKKRKREEMKQKGRAYDEMMYYDDEDYEEDWEQYEAEVEDTIKNINPGQVF